MRVVLTACVLACAIGCSGRVATTESAREGVTKEKRTKEELEKALKGKSEDEVIKLIGRPEDTSDYGGTLHWNYRGKSITFSTITQKFDDVTIVSFDKTKKVVVGVN